MVGCRPEPPSPYAEFGTHGEGFGENDSGPSGWLLTGPTVFTKPLAKPPAVAPGGPATLTNPEGAAARRPASAPPAPLGAGLTTSADDPALPVTETLSTLFEPATRGQPSNATRALTVASIAS